MMLFKRLPNRAAACMLVGVASASAAQAPTVSLLPGLGEGSGNWASTANALRASGLQMTVVTPDLPTGSLIADQASYFASSFGSSIGPNGILIGHSNGGLVARTVSRANTVRGTATIGSPNLGVPLVTNAPALEQYFGDLGWDLVVTLNDFGSGDEYWLIDDAIGSVWYDLLQLTGAFTSVENATGLNTTVAQLDDRASSSFLNDTLNAPGNVSAELAHTTTAVGVRVTAENYVYGGPLRLLSDASTAYDWHLFINAAGAALLGVDAYIVTNDYPLTAQNAREIADVDLDALLLFDLEDVWCAGVTEPHLTQPWMLRCEDNDGFLPVTYQTRPSANRVDWTGAKAHLSETEESGRVQDLLQSTFHVQ